jgi:calcineurin-like phosphoesterase
MMPARFGVGRGTVRINGAMVTIDPATGRALSIERVTRYWHD